MSATAKVSHDPVITVTIDGVEEGRHEHRLHVLLRLLAPSPAAARLAVEQTMELARARATGDDDYAWGKLAALGLAQLRPHTAGFGPSELGDIRPRPDFSALRQALNGIGPTASPYGSSPSDGTLLVLARALSLPERSALALTTLYGVSPEASAAALGIDGTQVRELESEALRSLHGTLAGYALRQLQGAALSAKAAPRLRPLPVRADGTAVIRGTRVYIDPDAPNGIIGALLKLLARLQERFKHTLHLVDPSDDDVGKTHNHQPLDPTPTTQPIRKPRPTPSLEPHRMPKPTSGTAVHHRSPAATPSLQRLSARSRPLPSAPSTYSWHKR